VAYSILVLADEQGNIISHLTLKTNRGPVVVFFEDKEKLAVIGQDAANQILENGQNILAIDLESSSLEEASRVVIENEPTLSGAMFMMDSDPFVTRVVTSLR
jgi:hypothetical protein